MSGRRHRPYVPSTDYGEKTIQLLRDIHAGRVVRDDVDGTRRGMWALYVLDGVEVGFGVRRLSELDLVHAPLSGPPRLTANALALLESKQQAHRPTRPGAPIGGGDVDQTARGD